MCTVYGTMTFCESVNQSLFTMYILIQTTQILLINIKQEHILQYLKSQHQNNKNNNNSQTMYKIN